MNIIGKSNSFNVIPIVFQSYSNRGSNPQHPKIWFTFRPTVLIP